MKLSFLLFLISWTLAGCAQNSSQKQTANSSSTHVGGRCEGCEAIYESTTPFDKLLPVDTLPDFNEQGSKMKINGIVYKPDGKTPAPNVVLYVYHTDQTGRYPTKGDEKGWAKRHGYIRGWVKTDEKGRYEFYTLKPAAYPGQNQNPAHIHITVKEPDKNEYWIDDYLFDDDPILTAEMRRSQRQRGGNGIIKLISVKNMMLGTRNIILGSNVTDYPKD